MIDDEDRDLTRALRARADAITVPWAPLRRRRQRANLVIVFASVAAVVVVAVLAGGALNARRLGAVAGPEPAGVQLEPDARYGWLAFANADRTGDLRVYDEMGVARSDAVNVLGAAVTSPNGRYVALWAQPQRGPGSTLRILDAALGTVSPVLFSTDEVLAGTTGVAWASDSSAVVVATTTYGSRGGDVLRNTIRTVERTGVVREIGAFSGPSIDPVGWDRAADRIAFKVGVLGSGKMGYWIVQPNGPADQTITVDDVPIAADGASRYVVSFRNCAGCAPAFVVHDFLSYATVREIALGPPGTSGGWSAQFRPRSVDLIVRTDSGVRTNMTFKVTLYPDAGRGTPRDIDLLRIDDPSGVSEAPVFQVRADGSALFFGIRNHDGTFIGHLIDLATGVPTNLAQRPVVAQAIASVVLDPKLGGVATPTPTTSSLAACRSGQLSGTYESMGAALGSRGASFRLAVATGSCEAPADPPVQFRDANGALILSATPPTSSGPVQTLRAGTSGKDSGFLAIQWSGHGTEPDYRCATMGPPIASVAVDFGRPAGIPANVSNVLSIDIPSAQRFSFCADPPERVSASIIGSRQP